MMTMAAANVRGFNVIVVGGEKTRFVRAAAARVSIVTSLRHSLPGLNASSCGRASSQPLFRLSALPEDDVGVEAANVVAEPTEEASKYEGPTVKVKFELQRECHFGQEFKVVGGDTQFGDWEPSAGVGLTWTDGHLWTAEVDVPEGKRLEYKYVLVTGQEGEVEWQPGSNLVLEATAGAEPIVLSDAWEEAQSEPTAEVEVQPAELEVPPAEPEAPSAELEVPPPAEPEVPSAEPEVPSAELEVPSAKPEVPSVEPEVPSAEPEVPSAELEVAIHEPVVQSAEPEVQSADESDNGGWELFSSDDDEVSTPGDAVANVAASATVGALNAGVKAAHAVEGGLDAISPFKNSSSSKANGVVESQEETPTAVEIPVLDAALAAAAEPAAPAKELHNTSNGASSSESAPETTDEKPSVSSEAEYETTEEKPSMEESKMEAQQTSVEEQPRVEQPNKLFNPFQKDIEWLAKTLFGKS